MVICDDPPFVFVAVPRTASRAIRRMLCKRFPGASEVEAPQHTTDIPPDKRGHFTWAVVRNPYVRDLSHYLRRTGPLSYMRKYIRKFTYAQYLEWLLNPDAYPKKQHDRPQAAMLVPLRMDAILRYENLMDGLRSLPFLKNQNVKLPFEGASPPYRPRDYYGPHEVELLKARAAADFLFYGYDIDSIPETSR